MEKDQIICFMRHHWLCFIIYWYNNYLETKNGNWRFFSK